MFVLTIILLSGWMIYLLLDSQPETEIEQHLTEELPAELSISGLSLPEHPAISGNLSMILTKEE